jgi:hypothetical protein
LESINDDGGEHIEHNEVDGNNKHFAERTDNKSQQNNARWGKLLIKRTNEVKAGPIARGAHDVVHDVVPSLTRGASEKQEHGLEECVEVCATIDFISFHNAPEESDTDDCIGEEDKKQGEEDVSHGWQRGPQSREQQSNRANRFGNLEQSEDTKNSEGLTNVGECDEEANDRHDDDDQVEPEPAVFEAVWHECNENDDDLDNVDGSEDVIGNSLRLSPPVNVTGLVIPTEAEKQYIEHNDSQHGVFEPLGGGNSVEKVAECILRGCIVLGWQGLLDDS